MSPRDGITGDNSALSEALAKHAMCAAIVHMRSAVDIAKVGTEVKHRLHRIQGFGLSAKLRFPKLMTEKKIMFC